MSPAPSGQGWAAVGQPASAVVISSAIYYVRPVVMTRSAGLRGRNRGAALNRRSTSAERSGGSGQASREGPGPLATFGAWLAAAHFPGPGTGHQGRADDGAEVASMRTSLLTFLGDSQGGSSPVDAYVRDLRAARDQGFDFAWAVQLPWEHDATDHLACGPTRGGRHPGRDRRAADPDAPSHGPGTGSADPQRPVGRTVHPRDRTQPRRRQSGDVGIPWDRPVRRINDYLDCLLPLLTTGEVDAVARPPPRAEQSGYPAPHHRRSTSRRSDRSRRDPPAATSSARIAPTLADRRASTPLSHGCAQIGFRKPEKSRKILLLLRVCPLNLSLRSSYRLATFCLWTWSVIRCCSWMSSASFRNS